MESNFSGQEACLIVEVNGQFCFDTDQEATYWVYFTEADGYIPSASFAQNVKMFGFEQKSQRRNRADIGERVAITIRTILYRFFTAYPDMILVYVCSDESVQPSVKTGEKFRNSRIAKKRSAVFSKWFEAWQKMGLMPIEKIDYCLYDQLYCSCLFRSGNPYESDIKQLIDETILAKQP